MFDDATVRAVTSIAARLKVEAASLLAVAEVESAGKAYARVEGKNEPLIRFEGHYFDRRLTPEQRKRARAAGLASPAVGGVKNPNAQADRWKLLNRAIAINSNAALESVSWGVGQVMGSHWKDLGYSSVSALVNEARSSVGGQVEVMARFIEKNRLAGVLRDKQWAKFARAYNGPAYAQNKYDTKMAAAYARWVKKLASMPAPQVEESEAAPATPTVVVATPSKPAIVVPVEETGKPVADNPAVVVTSDPAAPQPKVIVTAPPTAKPKTGLAVIVGIIIALIAGAIQYLGG